ncbi:alanine racemase [Intrasporangium calvum]|uniref:Alanine racemase domain protein n=1 Tax=Intrasporangium calvum (strain ATCC 23552 / DSM 43043 / JCM 3097 / NBRC 12989 / NCIMB 10167 / NRRL B-3866 / 7 KIP) TaxID=710696 RepID=E6SAJ5_INTC7|nr:alanine racemase [Intrasporangium calvum]ADU47245.1 alanine racemase domain protein [Intrasporangium calvum DSM 43043]AXG12486.1 amino acid deaminase/aldolase [Intrasporangium calvum]
MSRRPAQAPVAQRLSRATRRLPAPLAVVDLRAFDRNAEALVARANGKPIRVATKSLRSRPLIERALGVPGFEGLMCYSLREALWWAREGLTNLLVAYPSVDLLALGELASEPGLRGAVCVMVDSVEGVDLIAKGVGDPRGLRVAVDVDASLRVGPAHLGVRRSPLRAPEQVEAVVRRAQEHGLAVVGLMFYDAQIAGLPDSSPVVRRVKSRSDAQLSPRRAEITDLVRQLADVEFVNGGGTGSLHVTGLDPALTELAAGSGLYAPTLFDGYDGLGLEPAAFFACPVVRRPADDVVTVYSGGYVASGPVGGSRLPQPLPEQGLQLLRAEGAGEVQTPLRGRAAARVELGDRIWFRHAKAGELAERFTHLALVDGDEVVGHAATYRGEGQSFG